MAEDGGNVSAENDENFHKVIIIGGGMAGLSAANHLKKNGIDDFVILEARSRIGGRIVSIPLKDHRVELGANWIHGVLGNPVFEMAMSHGLVNIINNPKPHKVIAATENGKQVPFGILHEIYEAYICFLRRCEEYYLCQYLPPADIQSVGEHINLEAAIYLDRMPSSEEKNLRRLIFDCLLKRETCISGCHSMNEIDLLELGSYTELQGGNIQLPSGYSSILEPMTKNIPSENIMLKKPVQNIIWKSNADNEDGNESDDSDKTVIEDLIKTPSVQKAEALTSSSYHSRKHIQIICEDDQKFQCDHVICTLPLGVLKAKASTMFIPPLPKYKMEAIDKLLFGTVDKIFLEYSEPFLNPNITEILLLWDEAPSNEVNIEDSWYKKIYSFSKVSETLLLGWISGQEADYMETLPSDVVASTCTKILKQFLNDKSIPEPVTCVCTSWKNQPYTKGSYTAIAVGACQADIESLAQPLYASSKQKKPVVVFAGEHTHTNFYSTVHGAYLTGRTAAQHLLDEGRRNLVLECNDTGDLSGWLQSLSLER